MNKSHSNLKHIVETHQGNLVDKWSTYIDDYEILFDKIREKDIVLVEVGVQNGGSLEIWAKYFQNAQCILGIDNDLSVSQIPFQEEKIEILIADATQFSTAEEIRIKVTNFDIFIDDGSHINLDVINTFIFNWPNLSYGGYYVIEDVHASYQQSYGGGFHGKASIIEFFKCLVDFTQFDYWGVDVDCRTIFEEVDSENYLLSNINDYTNIGRIGFYNSLIVLQKSVNSKNLRIIKGESAFVNPLVLQFKGSSFTSTNEMENPNSRFFNAYSEMQHYKTNYEKIMQSKTWHYLTFFRKFRAKFR